MNMIEILESIKEDIDDEELRPDAGTHGYLLHPISEHKRTLIEHLKDRKSLESLGDILLMMLDSDEPYGGGDNFEYAINEMKRYFISAKDLYEYLKISPFLTRRNKTTPKKQKDIFEKYDIPFFIEVTHKLAESYKQDAILQMIEGK